MTSAGDDVWLLFEYTETEPQKRHLYGAFTSEAAALKDYGDLRAPYLIDVLKVRVFA